MTAQIFLIDVKFVSLQTQEKVRYYCTDFSYSCKVYVSPNSGESLYDGKDFDYWCRVCVSPNS